VVRTERDVETEGGGQGAKLDAGKGACKAALKLVAQGDDAAKGEHAVRVDTDHIPAPPAREGKKVKMNNNVLGISGPIDLCLLCFPKSGNR
jgi:hypothetical protein